MKERLLSLLLTAVLITGCAQVTDKSENIQNDTSINTIESSKADSEETAQEPYILTFEATTIEGEEITSDCFADSKLTMINVWATYCNPCLSEMPDLGQIAGEYDAADFQLLGIISDVMEADEAKITEAKELIEETKADYPHLLLNQSLYSNLVGAVNAVPTTFFFTEEGELLGYVTGSQSKDVWKSIIDELLADME